MLWTNFIVMLAENITVDTILEKLATTKKKDFLHEIFYNRILICVNLDSDYDGYIYY